MAHKSKPSKSESPDLVMLAADARLEDLTYPLIGSPKIDGWRGFIRKARLYTRSGKNIPNVATDKFFSHPALEGMDGELVCGNPAASDVYSVSSSGLRTERFDPNATFLVFDLMGDEYVHLPFSKRQAKLAARVASLPTQFRNRVVLVVQKEVRDLAEALELEDKCLTVGFEGLILRAAAAAYKFGRSTVLEQGMLKLKRFVDSEAVITSMTEEVEGDTMRPKGRLGTVGGIDLHTGVAFDCGSGFSGKQRDALWRRNLVGDIMVYRFTVAGTKNKPRHPRFKALRSPADMDPKLVARAAELMKQQPVQRPRLRLVK